MNLKGKLKRLEVEANQLAEREKQEKQQKLFDNWETEELRTFVAYCQGEITSLSDNLKAKVVEVQQQSQIINTGKGYTEKELKKIYDSI